jgi:O-antigen/teichoic acid export membrane protein
MTSTTSWVVQLRTLLRSTLRSGLRSGFLRAVATLSSGQFLAALVPLLAAPLLGRLYVPSDYGVLATYLALSNVLGTVSTFQLQQGIVAELSDARAVALVTVCRSAALLVAGAVAIVTLGIFWWMGTRLEYAAARGWFLLLPVAILASGSTAAIAALANRRRCYGAMAAMQVLAMVVTVATSIAFGLRGWGTDGLFASYFLGLAVATGAHLRLWASLRAGAVAPAWRRQLALVRRHRKFATYTLPAEFVGTMTMQLPVLILGVLGATAVLGSFSRARQLVASPLGLIGSAVSQVFRQHASDEFRSLGSCQRLYARTFGALVLAGVLPTLVLMTFAPDIFRLLLGPNWTGAGDIARVLAPMLLLQLICSPLSSVFYIQGFQGADFKLSLASYGLMAGSIALAFYFTGQDIAVVYAYAFAYTVIYIIYILAGWAIVTGRWKSK